MRISRKAWGFAPGASEKHLNLNDEQGNPANALFVRYRLLPGAVASLVEQPATDRSEKAEGARPGGPPPQRPQQQTPNSKIWRCSGVFFKK